MKFTMRAVAMISLCSLSLCAAKRPDWVDSLPMAPHLYQGIGVAEDTGSAEDDRLRADQNARTEIVQEIGSTISSEVSSYYSESNASGELTGSESFDVFSSLSSAYTDATLEGLKIVDRYYDKKTKTYYSYATLLRSFFQEQMQKKALEARLIARERYSFAQEALAAGNNISALNHLSTGLSHVLVAQSVVKEHLRGDLKGDGEEGFLDAGLSQALGVLLQNIKLSKSSGDGQKGERGQALPALLEGSVVYDTGSGLRPLPGLPLSMSVDGAEADFEPVISTDEAGVFHARIHTVHGASRPNPTVHFNVYLPNMDLALRYSGQNSGELFPAGLDYTFQMDVVATIRIFVRILEEIDGEPVNRSKSGGILIEALIDKKYKVIDSRQIISKISVDELDSFVGHEAFDALVEALKSFADYAIVGVVSSETSSTGTLNYARAQANLHAIDLRSGRIVASGFQENVKAAGNSVLKANTAAIRKCSNTAIAELLAQLDSALN